MCDRVDCHQIAFNSIVEAVGIAPENESAGVSQREWPSSRLESYLLDRTFELFDKACLRGRTLITVPSPGLQNLKTDPRVNLNAAASHRGLVGALP